MQHLHVLTDNRTEAAETQHQWRPRSFVATSIKSEILRSNEWRQCLRNADVTQVIWLYEIAFNADAEVKAAHFLGHNSESGLMLSPTQSWKPVHITDSGFGSSSLRTRERARDQHNCITLKIRSSLRQLIGPRLFSTEELRRGECKVYINVSAIIEHTTSTAIHAHVWREFTLNERSSLVDDWL